MKKIFSILFVCLFAIGNLYSQKVVSTPAGYKVSGHDTKFYKNTPSGERMHFAPQEVTPEELLACPENSVHSGEFDVDADYSGFQSSDQGRPLATKFYQSFSGCYYAVNGIRFMGIFNFYNEEDWVPCERDLSQPLRFSVEFYRNKDGYPGDLVYKEEIALMANSIGVTYGEYDIYEFTTSLKEVVKMENGFLSVSLLPGQSPANCWFSLLANSSVPGYGLLQVGSSEDYMVAALPVTYCLLGNGDVLGKKALKINRILSPSSTSEDKYEKVQVEVLNIGSDNIDDATLELWADNERVATEKIHATIKSQETYKYTFEKRVDCSSTGVHHFEIKNVTPGDEKIVDDYYKFTTTKGTEGEICESGAEDIYEYISQVTIGDIDNTSEKSSYSDYSDMKTKILPGESLLLTVKTKNAYGDYIGVWVDWNGNGSFNDSGDFMSYVIKDTLTINIPQNVTVTPGEKRLRIVLSYDTPTPCGSYAYGETEDYTLIVERPESSPAFSVDTKYIDATIKGYESKSNDIVIKNDNNTDMSGTVNIKYALPYSPNNRHITKATPVEAKQYKPKMSKRVAINRAPSAQPETQFVLNYDKENYTAVGLSSGTEATYATYYPGEMLANLKGMTISSVDVFVEDASEYGSIVIYGEKSQLTNGELITEQTFVPVPKSWNHIVLENPVTLSDKDLWIGAKFKGFKPNSYQIGSDAGPAIRGFGDIVNVGGSTWWSLADLGMDSNNSLRANITGERTPAISWLTADKSGYSITGANSETVKLTMNATDLKTTLYEAIVEITSNDILNQSVKIPVYLNSDQNSGVENTQYDIVGVYPNPANDYITVPGDVAGIYVFNLTGNIVKAVTSSVNNGVIDIKDLNEGIYIISVIYKDNTRKNQKFSVIR